MKRQETHQERFWEKKTGEEKPVRVFLLLRGFPPGEEEEEEEEVRLF